MHDSVEPGLKEDKNSYELVDVDVVVEGQEKPETQFSKFGDRVTMNEQQN